MTHGSAEVVEVREQRHPEEETTLHLVRAAKSSRRSVLGNATGASTKEHALSHSPSLFFVPGAVAHHRADKESEVTRALCVAGLGAVADLIYLPPLVPVELQRDFYTRMLPFLDADAVPDKQPAGKVTRPPPLRFSLWHPPTAMLAAAVTLAPVAFPDEACSEYAYSRTRRETT